MSRSQKSGLSPIRTLSPSDSESHMAQYKAERLSRRHLRSLLASAQAGDAEAREQIFLFLHTRFLALAKLRVMEEDAREIVQETLIVVDQHLSRFETVEHMIAFTDGVLRNKIGNFYRTRDRRGQHWVEWDKAPEPVYYMDGELEAKELERILLAAIDEVGKRSAACRAILLGLYEGATAEELCARLGFTKARMDEHLFRCRRTLRRILRRRYKLRV